MIESNLTNVKFMPKDSLNNLIAAVKEFVQAREWGQFHFPKNLSIAILLEAAEIAELFMWIPEAQSPDVAKAKQKQLEAEIADVFIYLLLLAEKVNCDPIAAAFRKIEENEVRYPIAKARGNARKYSDLAA